MFINDKWILIQEEECYHNHINLYLNFQITIKNCDYDKCKNELQRIFEIKSSVRVHSGGKTYSTYHYRIEYRSVLYNSENHLIKIVSDIIKKYELKE